MRKCVRTRLRAAIEALEGRALLTVAPVPDPVAYPTYIVEKAFGKTLPTNGLLAGGITPAASPAAAEVTPAEMRQAYGVNNIKFGSIVGDGSGQTIAIIDAYDDPNAFSDLTTFDTTYNLPVISASNFKKLNETGGTTLPAPGNNWQLEESLDIEWAHVIAPGASIILYEANSASFDDLVVNAVNTARKNPSVSVVSMSFGAGEFSGEGTTYDTYFTTPTSPAHQGVTFLASTGDKGSPGGYPAYSPNVVAVGGTTLLLNSDGTYNSETAWSGSGGGTSTQESVPKYQIGTQTTGKRTIPDISMDANPSSGVPVYDTYDGGWFQVGGTSLAAPMSAALIAIADQGRVLNGFTTLDGPTQTLPLLYSSPATFFHDVTSGSNGTTFTAGPGYDEVTGIGTPVANLLDRALAEASSNVALKSSANPSGSGQSVTFTATVTSSTAGTPTGTVTFKNGATVLGTGTLNGSGVATLPTTSLSIGANLITATYAGDSTFASNLSTPLTQTVNHLASATALATSGTPSKSGQSVTFTATVTGSGTPTGTVTFNDGSTTLGTGTLNGAGVATYTTTALSVASHSITATYGGDANFVSSTSSTLTQVVQQAASSTVLGTAPNPSVIGQIVTLTATVALSGAGGGTPTGTVTFKNGSTTLGTGTLNASGVATYTTSALTLGSHSLTASYGGSTNFTSSTSTTVSQVINQANSATALTPTADPSVIGQSITFTATVTAVSPGTGTPTGTVTFKDGSSTLGTGTLNASGVATYSTSTLSAASHSITASYGGDTNFTGSVSSTLTQVVQASGTLSGASATAPALTNLTALGTANWSHWGDSATPISMSGVTPINFTPIGTATINIWPTVADGFSWSNGTPTASASDDASTIYSSGLNTGYQLVLPADTQQRTVSFFVGAYAATGQLTATLSDGSASPYVATMDSTNTSVSTFNVYTITYQAGSAGQTLTLNWVQTNMYVSGGNIGIEALALTATPPAPTNLTAVSGNAQVALTWSPSVNAASYTVKRGTTSGAETNLPNGTTPSTSFTDSTAVNGTTYYYTVVANNSFGPSAASNEVLATPGALAGALSGNSAAAPALTNLTALGTANWSHWGDSTTPISMSGVTPINFNPIGAATINIWPTVADGFSWSNGTPTASASNDASTIYSSGLNTGYQLVLPADTQQRTVSFFVGAYAATGQLTATLSDGSASPYVATMDSTNTSVSTFNVYTITYQAGSAGQTLTLNWVQTNMYVSGGNIGIEALALTATPPAPTNLTAVSGNAQVALTWSPSVNAASYTVKRGTTSGAETPLPNGTTPSTSFTDSTAVNGTTYYYTVIANNSFGPSAASNEVLATPGALAGALSGNAAAAPALTNLTTLGTANWSHWGDSTTPVSMSGVTPINFTPIGTATINIWPTVADGFSWSNGTPTASASNDASTIYSSGLNTGYQLVLPADTQQRTVSFFVGAYAATGQLTATLSDGSASPYVATMDSTNTSVSTFNVYTITYQAGSAGQTLTLNWVQTNMYVSGGNIGIEALALSVATSPGAQASTLGPPASAASSASSTGNTSNASTANTTSVGRIEMKAVAGGQPVARNFGPTPNAVPTPIVVPAASIANANGSASPVDPMLDDVATKKVASKFTPLLSS